MTFDEAIERIMSPSIEGGYVNDPIDRGGETKYGISRAAYPTLDIAGLTRDMAKAIYRRDFWDRAHTDDIPDNLRLIYFDMTVNHGIDGAVRILQRACNTLPDMHVKEDGDLGPRTLDAADRVTPDRLRMMRLAYYADIVIRNPKQGRFWNGWKRRAFEI